MMTCEELLIRYFSMRLVGGSPQTKLLMSVAVRSLGEFLNRPAVLTDLNDATISAFAESRLANGSARATVQQNELKLLALWRFACQLGLVSQWPTIKPIRLPERTPKAWTEEELARLFGSISQTPGKISGIRAALWWETLHRLLWDTGERLEAVLIADWSQVNLNDSLIYVPAEHRKGKTRDKVYRLAADTVANLSLFPSRVGRVLVWHRCQTLIYAHYRKILARAGLPTDRNSMFHRMRRSVASHIKAAGGDATAAMDHASPSTTKGYIDPRVCPAVSPADLLFRPGVASPTY